MKSSVLSTLVLAAGASAHTIFQRVSVNGADQGQLVGLRAPAVNNPVLDVTSAGLTCNIGDSSSSTVITVPAGAQVGSYWQHIIGGPQGANDADNPIASSHKGPLIYYLAKVSNAATTGTTGLQWFKISQDGLDTSTGLWGVDRMIAGKGWHYFTLPSCIAPGQYLLRGEIIALHSAYTQGQAQFYVSCAQITVTGSGTFTGSNFLSIPGAYSATDPGILINIYDGALPNNGLKPYTPPGGAVQTCPSGGTTVVPPPFTSTTAVPTTAAPTTVKPPTSTTAKPVTTSVTGGAPLYGQCGGTGWAGATTCASGKCTVSNPYYSQCLP